MFDFDQYRQITLMELAEKEKVIEELRNRMNDARALEKAFYGKEDEYQYLTVERMLLEHTGEYMRFYDWVMDQRYEEGISLYRLTAHLDLYFMYLEACCRK